ncbi:unnamed protein product [Ilex paraguariensis]|uniref:Dymeclin n=1 Tax=Ilex paraguariensis TaxID=185542 RepID=A0ABC8RJ05_9AQUA
MSRDVYPNFYELKNSSNAYELKSSSLVYELILTLLKQLLKLPEINAEESYIFVCSYVLALYSVFSPSTTNRSLAI